MNVSDTESNSAIKNEYLQQRGENIRRAFAKQDKNSDGIIDKNELIDFLDSNCRSGKFDRNLANKIFSILDLDQDGKITIEEFIKSYVGIIDDIKTQIRELEINYKQEDKNKSRLELLVKQNLNEVLNDEDLGPNSKFTIEIINIEYLKSRLTYDGILIRIFFNNKRESTKILSTSTNDLVWQQKFEFPVTRKDDIVFEILNVDPNDNTKQLTLGSVRFSLNLIERQEEYDVLLEVPDLNDDQDVYAKINAKIQFIWSLHKFYTDELVKSEERFNKIKSLISSKQNILGNLNEPFDAYENWDRKLSVDKRTNNKFTVGNNAKPGIEAAYSSNKNNNNNINYGSYNKNNPNDFNMKNNVLDNSKFSSSDKNIEVTLTPFENKVADNFENFVREKLHYSNVPWMNIFSKFIILVLALSLFCSVNRSDFIGIIIPLIIFVIYSTTFQKEVLKNINRFIFGIGANSAYDLLWLLVNLKSFSGESFDGFNNGKLFGVVYFISFISFLIKLILLGTLFIIKKKKINEFLLNNPNV